MAPNIRDVLSGREKFDEYRQAVQARLETRRQERLEFLEGAVSELVMLLDEAQALGHEELERDLVGRLEAARAQLSAVVQRGEQVAPTAQAARETVSSPASSEAPAEVQPAAAPASPANGHASTPAPEPARPVATGATTTPPAAPPTATTPPPTAPGTPINRVAPVPPGAPRRSWTPRAVPEIDAEVSRLEEELESISETGELGLLRLKALACRQRRAFWELEDQGAYAGQARALYGAVKGRVIETYGDRRVLPLNTGIGPQDPQHWEELARRYEGLIPALEAFAWYRENAEALGPATARELLECVGAAQQQLYRMLDECFRSAADDQQRSLYEALLSAAEDEQIFLESLNPRRTDEELRRAGGALQKTWQRLRDAIEKKAQQQSTTQHLMALVEDPLFGTRDEDSGRLRDAAAACLKAGVPASNRLIRDALLPWSGLLEDEPDLAPLLKEIDKELDRRMQKGQPEEVSDDDEEFLSVEIQGLLQELLPHTRGKKCLFIGGDNREEKRKLIEATLELEELIWPQARRTYSVYHFEAEIARCDIIALLVRFMRTGFKQAVELSHKYGTRSVRVPRGLGLARIIQDFHNQLVPRSGGEA